MPTRTMPRSRVRLVEPAGAVLSVLSPTLPACSTLPCLSIRSTASQSSLPMLEHSPVRMTPPCASRTPQGHWTMPDKGSTRLTEAWGETLAPGKMDVVAGSPRCFCASHTHFWCSEPCLRHLGEHTWDLGCGELLLPTRPARTLASVLFGEGHSE